MNDYTNGKAIVGASGVTVWNEDGVTRLATCDKPDDAALIADAFNVARETGRTPRQLADERARLLALVKIVNAVRGFLSDEEWKAVRAAIADAEGATP